MSDNKRVRVLAKNVNNLATNAISIKLPRSNSFSWIRGNVSSLNSEEGLISKEESVWRLIIIGMTTALFLATTATTILHQELQLIPTQNIIFIDRQTESIASKYPLQPRILFLTSTEILYEAKAVGNQLAEKSFVIKLPELAKGKYIMFKVNHEIVGFIKEDLGADITKVYPSGIHHRIPDSKFTHANCFINVEFPDPEHCLGGSQTGTLFVKNYVQVGDKIWFTHLGLRWQVLNVMNYIKFKCIFYISVRRLSTIFVKSRKSF